MVISMRKSIAARSAFTCGVKALDYLKQIHCSKVVIVSGKESTDISIAQKVHNILQEQRAEISDYAEIGVRPSFQELLSGVSILKSKHPDTLIAVGEEAVINAVKMMMLLYEYPEIDFEHIDDKNTENMKLQTKLIVIPADLAAAEVEEVSQITSIVIDSKEVKRI